MYLDFKWSIVCCWITSCSWEVKFVNKYIFFVIKDCYGIDGHCWCYGKLCTYRTIWSGSPNVSKYHRHPNHSPNYHFRGKKLLEKNWVNQLFGKKFILFIGSSELRKMDSGIHSRLGKPTRSNKGRIPNGAFCYQQK